MLSQVVLLHPIGSELIGRHGRESGAMQRLHAKQQCNGSCALQHDVASSCDLRLGRMVNVRLHKRPDFLQCCKKVWSHPSFIASTKPGVLGIFI